MVEESETATSRHSIGLWVATLFTGVGAAAILWIMGVVLHRTFPRFDQPDIPLEPLLDGTLTALFLVLMVGFILLLGAGAMSAVARIYAAARAESGETTNRDASVGEDSE